MGLDRCRNPSNFDWPKARRKRSVYEQEVLVFLKPRLCGGRSRECNRLIRHAAPVDRVGAQVMDMNFLVWVLVAFLVGLTMGCALGNHWAKVAFYWTQNKIRHLRDHH